MATRSLSIFPAAVLRQRALPLPDIDDDVRALMGDMVETMRHEQGIGLAAPQVGILRRVIVMDCSDEDDPSPVLWKMVNPEIVARSDELATREEGCLSIPDWRGEVTRPAWVRVRYLGAEGDEQEMEAEGLLAACVQHEIDHLDGKLFIDHLSRVRRDMIIRKMTKEARLERSG